jgi:hypothetical protein
VSEWYDVCPSPWQARVVEAASVLVRGMPGVVAVWLGGSLATGTADVHSDVDLNVAVTDDHLETWRDSWAAAVERCAGPLLATHPIGGNVVGGFCLTANWEHIDLVVHAASALGQPNPCRILHDPAGLLEERLDGITRGDPWFPTDEVTLFLYLLGNLAVTLGRDELTVAQGGVGALRDLLVGLMLAENGVRKTDGQKRLNPYLTEAQRSELVSLPCAAADVAGIVAACLELRATFVGRARRLATRTGEQFPEALLVATDAHLRRHLGEVWGSAPR